jgi:hypothetical protein
MSLVGDVIADLAKRRRTCALNRARRSPFTACPGLLIEGANSDLLISRIMK